MMRFRKADKSPMQILKILLFPVCALLIAVASAHAGLRGDWHSSGGDMMRPYEPAYPWRYDCQAEYTDHLERISDGKKEIPKGRHYHLYLVHKITFDNKNTFFAEGNDWRYVAVLVDPEEGEQREMELKEAPNNARQPERVGIGMHFDKAKKPGQDKVRLTATARLPLGDGYYHMEMAREEGTRADKLLQVRAHASLYWDEDAPEILRLKQKRTLQVVCDKGR